MKAAIPSLIVAAICGLLFVPQAEAQRAGFVTGIVTTTMPSPPVMPFLTAPVQPFVTAPVQPFGGPPVQPFMTAPVQPFGVSPFPSAPNQQTHYRQAQIIGPATTVMQPPQGYFFGAAPPAAPPAQPGAPLAFGASRAVVVSRIGPPLVSVFTSTSETMYFNGGITVVIQNGQVVRPR